MDESEYFLWAGNFLYLASYLVSGIFLLRILSIVGGLSLMGYYFLVAGGPLWTAVIWGVAFFMINAIQLFLLYKSRKPVRLNAEEYDTLKRIDPSMDHKQYRKWTEISDQSIGPISKEVNDDRVALVVESNTLKMINAEGFVVEEQRKSSEVNLSQNDQILIWEIDELKALLEVSPELRTFWQQLMNEYVFSNK